MMYQDKLKFKLKYESNTGQVFADLDIKLAMILLSTTTQLGHCDVLASLSWYVLIQS